MREHLRRIGLGLEIAATYPRAWWLLRRRPLPSALRQLRRSATPQAVEDRHLRRARQLGRATTRMLSPLPVDSRCLIRSLVLVRMLDRRHIPTRVVIGVHPGADEFAHAWVEVDGNPVLDPGGFSERRLAEL